MISYAPLWKTMKEKGVSQYKLIKDYGVRNLTYGNASGEQFNGNYRSFLVDIDGRAEIFSIGLSVPYHHMKLYLLRHNHLNAIL